jgi:hypothetical protein
MLPKKERKKRKDSSTLSKRGEKIMELAKEIRKQEPNLMWRECVKRAAKQLKEQKQLNSDNL